MEEPRLPSAEPPPPAFAAAAGALEGCEVVNLACLPVDGVPTCNLRLSIARPLEEDLGEDPEVEDKPYTIYLFDAEPCLFGLVVCVVRSLHFYKKIQGGGHFPQILVVGVSHARKAIQEHDEEEGNNSWWWKVKRKFRPHHHGSSTNFLAQVAEKVEKVVEAILQPNDAIEIHPGAGEAAWAAGKGTEGPSKPPSKAESPAGSTIDESEVVEVHAGVDEEAVEDHWLRLKQLRRRDFTPPPRGAAWVDTHIDEHAKSGQAPAYLTALESDVIPFIEGRYNTHPHRDHRCLVGNSLSGLLACLELVKGQHFGHVVMGSPSVWWDDERILDVVRGISEPIPTQVLITVGSEESDQMVEGAAKLEHELGVVEGRPYRIKRVVLEGEDHHTCKAAMTSNMVRWVVKNWGHQPSMPKLSITGENWIT